MSVLSKKEKKRLVYSTLLNLGISLADIGSLIMILFIIDFYTGTTVNSSSPLISWLSRNSLLPVIIFFGLFSLKNVGAYLIYRSQFRFIGQVANRLSLSRLAAYFEGPYVDYVTTDSAAQARRISYYPLEFCQHVLAGMQQIITELVLILLSVSAIVIYNIKLFVLLCIVLLPPLCIALYILKKRAGMLGAQAKTSSESALQYLHEALNAYVEANIYNKKEFFISRYFTYQQRFNKYLTDTMIMQGMPHRIMEVFAVLGLFILIAVTKGNAMEGYPFVAIGAFMAAAYKIIPGIVRVLNLSSQMRAYEFTIKGLLPVKATEVAIKKQIKTSVIHSVEFREVGFAFSGQPVLKGFNMMLQRGDFLGLCGKSGEGKTTILNLLLGFWETNSGAIFINSKPVNQRSRQQFRSSIAYVKQQTFLFHASILENIILGDEICNRKKLQTAIEWSGLEKLLKKYPEGLQKMITENGKNISGGERQRIAIARALYKDADMIILDEPFNELDEASEYELVSRLKNLSQSGKLIILITHNLKSLELCNKTVSLDESYTSNSYHSYTGLSQK